jgi:4-amino-4-deoxy-L-arabinose transferase-like glycosyltransferase
MKDTFVQRCNLITAACVAIYAAGLSVDVIDVDAAQYAAISRELLSSDNWLEITTRHRDYLDKPPLLFWLSAFSIKLLGVSNVAYKLPSFLFGILGILSTAKLGALLYDKRTGSLSGLMAATGLSVFIMFQDIRTDTLLFGTVTFAIWQIFLYLKSKNFWSLVLGFSGVGLAMLSKGPLGLVMPAMALSADFLYKRQWINFLRWQWLVGLVIVALILLPMSIGLYNQFDLHPEKMVNGNTGVSGLRFFYWTQSFGRITGESDWGTKFDNGAGPFFFTHTFLWVFLPWSLLTILALLKSGIILIRSRFREGFLPEVITFGGFVLIFLALSASKYKLPHYIYVLVPLAAILSARFYLVEIQSRKRPALVRLVNVYFVIVAIALTMIPAVILLFVFSENTGWMWIIFAVFTLATVFVLWKEKSMLTALCFVLLNCYAIGNLHFYPKLLTYQSGSVAGTIIASDTSNCKILYLVSPLYEYSVEFNSGIIPQHIYADSSGYNALMNKGECAWLYIDQEGYDHLYPMIKPKVTRSEKLEHFAVQFLTPEFLNSSTRSTRVSTRYLLLFDPNTSEN